MSISDGTRFSKARARERVASSARPKRGAARAAARRLSPLERWRALPEGPPHFELIEGEIVRMAPPKFRHQVIVMNLSAPLYRHIRAKRLGELVPGPGVVLGALNADEPDPGEGPDRQEAQPRGGRDGAPLVRGLERCPRRGVGPRPFERVVPRAGRAHVEEGRVQAGAVPGSPPPARRDLPRRRLRG